VFFFAFGLILNVIRQTTSIIEFALLELPHLVTSGANKAVAENGFSVKKIKHVTVSRN
jgi:hypothetical protein